MTLKKTGTASERHACSMVRCQWKPRATRIAVTNEEALDIHNNDEDENMDSHKKYWN
jgi:hypothetical protein